MFVGDVRFKLKLEVEDCTGVGVFVMFEREYSYLFRKSCAKIFSESMKLPKVIFADACYILFLVIDIIVDIVFSIYFQNIRNNDYPLLFNELVEKKMLLKIETKSVSPERYCGTFHMKRICDDTTILSMFNLDSADLTPTKVKNNGTIMNNFCFYRNM